MEKLISGEIIPKNSRNFLRIFFPSLILIVSLIPIIDFTAQSKNENEFVVPCMARTPLVIRHFQSRITLSLLRDFASHFVKNKEVNLEKQQRNYNIVEIHSYIG